MSRQRLRPSLGDSTQVPCPRCEGQGAIRTIQSLALAILRVIEDEAMKDDTRQVNVQVPVDVAAFLLNEKRDAIIDLEHRHTIRILLLPNPHMVTPQYQVNRIREEEDGDRVDMPSFNYITPPKTKTEELHGAREEDKADEPAIKTYASPAPPASLGGRDQGFIRRIWSAVFGPVAEQKAEQGAQNTPTSTTQTDAASQHRQQNHRHARKGRGHQNKDRNPNARRNQNNRNRRGSHSGQSRSRDDNRPHENRDNPAEVENVSAISAADASNTEQHPQQSQPEEQRQQQHSRHGHSQHRRRQEHASQPSERPVTHQSEQSPAVQEAVREAAPERETPPHAPVETTAVTKPQVITAAKEEASIQEPLAPPAKPRLSIATLSEAELANAVVTLDQSTTRPSTSDQPLQQVITTGGEKFVAKPAPNYSDIEQERRRAANVITLDENEQRMQQSDKAPLTQINTKKTLSQKSTAEIKHDAVVTSKENSDTE